VYHNSLLLKYVPKRQEFDGDQMDARTTLAVIDHNLSQNQGQRLTHKDKAFIKRPTHLLFSIYFVGNNKKYIKKQPIPQEYII
jgi:hypothetical protein